jgi:hypothetical protein
VTTPNTNPERHHSYRNRLKARGFRQIVLWVPDTHRRGFAEVLRRQLAVVEAAEEDRDTLALIAAAADWGDRCGVGTSLRLRPRATAASRASRC